MSSAVRATKRDLARTQQEILRVATEHFTRLGYFGARVDDIAAETSTTKRMIYYCFESKDGLFTAALRATYGAIRAFEDALGLDDLKPRDAIARYVGETLRYHERHPELALLARAENLLGGVHLAADADEPVERPIVAQLDRVLERGRQEGDFRDGVAGIEVHIVVSGLCNFRITNESTIRALFGYELRDPRRLGADVEQYQNLVLGWLHADQVGHLPPRPRGGAEPTPVG